MQNSIINSYLDKIILVENDTDNFQSKIVLPDNSITIAFQCGKPIFEKIDGKRLPLSGSEVLGQMTRSKEYLYAPHSKTILVKIKPWAAGSFLNNDLHEFTDHNISLSLVFDKYFVATLEDQITSSSNTREVVMDILRQLFNYRITDESILLAINTIYRTNGQVKVADLACKTFSSKRNFERKFKETTGLTPKKFIGNIRFQKVLQLLGKNNSLSDITHSCGYYDQAHFIRHFKSITGFTPKNSLAKLCRIFPMTTTSFTSSLRHELLLQN